MPLAEYTNITSVSPKGRHSTLTCVQLCGRATTEAASTLAPLTVKLIVLSVVFSVIFVIGLLVLAPDHACAEGVVASVNDVLRDAPGNGQALVLILPYELGSLLGLADDTPAHTG